MHHDKLFPLQKPSSRLASLITENRADHRSQLVVGCITAKDILHNCDLALSLQKKYDSLHDTKTSLVLYWVPHHVVIVWACNKTCNLCELFLLGCFVQAASVPTKQRYSLQLWCYGTKGYLDKIPDSQCVSTVTSKDQPPSKYLNQTAIVNINAMVFHNFGFINILQILLVSIIQNL